MFRYLAALGKTRTAQIHRDARIGEAESKRDAGIKEAIANQERLKVRYENDTEIAKAKRDFELKQAAYDIEVRGKFCGKAWLNRFVKSYVGLCCGICCENCRGLFYVKSLHFLFVKMPFAKVNLCIGAK